jgi:rhamnogalacturonan endolyase
MMMEKESWPYDFALSEDFQKTEQRGCISGRLLVRDRYSVVAFPNIPPHYD